jgi:hypothetical protein
MKPGAENMVIEVRYKTKTAGLVNKEKESMEEAENQINLLKQLAGFEVIGIFVNGRLVEGSKPEKKEEWKKPPRIGGRDLRNRTGATPKPQPKQKRTASLDEYKIEFPKDPRGKGGYY